ncbi:MAG: c-type cytochrome [Bacteroidota bacterium]
MKKRKLISTLLAIVIITYSDFKINETFAQKRSKTNVKTKKSKATIKPTAAEIEEGKALISKSDCLSCHKLNMRLIGPSYKEVAAKYPASEASYALLTQKVINGGTGVWGQVAMAPHPNLPVADIKKMIGYILTIK